MKFDHIGVVVSDLQAGRDHISDVLGIGRWTPPIADPINGVNVQFGIDGSGVCYELIAPNGPNSPVAQALEARRSIINHVAYLVDDLDAAARRMRASRCIPTGPARPAIAYDNHRIQFFLSPLLFIVELIEAPSHQHRYAPPATLDSEPG